MADAVLAGSGNGSAPVGPAKLELRDIHLRYLGVEGETEAIRDVSFRIDEGEFVAIVGPSGCGKTTFLSLVAGLLRPTEGEVLLDGQRITGPSRHVGYMLQHDHLFPWRTVLQNVLIGPEIQGLPRDEARSYVLDLLERYGLAGFQDHSPEQLSGGMRQRVALIRTLATRPKVLLLDEPFSALDFQTRLTLCDEVATILRQEGKTVVLVTHDISEAISMADRVIVLSRRPGAIKAEHRFDFTRDGRRLSPFEIRGLPEFAEHFDQVWEELDVHVSR